MLNPKLDLDPSVCLLMEPYIDPPKMVLLNFSHRTLAAIYHSVHLVYFHDFSDAFHENFRPIY